MVLTDYNVMIDGGNTFDQPIKNDLRTYEKIQKITTGPGDDYMTSFLLDYPYFKKYCNMIARSWSTHSVLEVDPKKLQQIYFPEDRGGTTTRFFIIE